MASTIDATKPVAGNPTTQSVRDNFAAAKSEIEALQSADTALTASVALKAPINNATFTGTTTIPTASITSLTFNGVALTVTGTQLNGFDARITANTNDIAAIPTYSAATTTTAGVVELATNTETVTGTSSTLATTPAGVAAAIVDITGGELSAYAPLASPAFTGVISYNGTGITSTAAELNKLDGFTGTVADLNYAKDLRATGVTSTEFDRLDGVTSSIQTQLNAKAPIASPTFTGSVTLPATTFDAEIVETVFSVTGTSPALNPANGTVQTWTLTANSSPTVTSFAAGESITLMVADGSGAFNVTWPTISWIGGSAPASLPTTGFAVITLWKVAGTVYGSYAGDA